MAAPRLGRQLTRLLGRATRDGAREWLRGRTTSPAPRTRSSAPGPTVRPEGTYPGDFDGVPEMSYAPTHDGNPDPGEIIWTWVPFEEDHTRGKDRPVLVIGHDGGWLLALMLTSRDHDRDAAQEARRGRQWVDIGSGPWDRQGRPSEARVDRIVRVDPATVRREGAVLSHQRFAAVAAAVQAAH